MYTWRSEWIQPFESVWSIFEKFKFANEATSIDLLREFGTERIKNLKGLNGSGIRNLYSLQGFNEHLLTLGFNLNVFEFNNYSMERVAASLERKLYGYNCFFHKIFVYCQLCMCEGHHSIFHQFKLLRRCPYHLCELTYSCPNCNEEMIYMLWKDNDQRPYMCSCGYLLFNDSKDWIKLWSTQRKISDPLLLEWMNYSKQDRVLYFNENNIIRNEKGLEMIIEVYKKTSSEKELIQKSSSFVYTIDKNAESWKLNDELYIITINVFKSIDLHIRNLMFKHKKCLYFTRKHFSKRRIECNCESSNAYLTWRNTLLIGDPKYWKYVNLSLRPTKFNHNFATPFFVIEEQLKHLYNEWYFDEKNKTIKDSSTLKWIFGKIVGSLLIAYWSVCQEATIESRKNKSALDRDSLSSSFLNRSPIIFANFPNNNFKSSSLNQYFEFNTSSITLNKDLLCCTTSDRNSGYHSNAIVSVGQTKMAGFKNVISLLSE